jgi:hypothetical protein
LRRTTWILPIIKCEALPYQVALSGVIKGKGEGVGDWDK